MLPECPEDLRPLLPFLQRASELKTREPVISYYCGFYAVNMAISKGYPRNTENDAFLGVLFDKLEQEKKELEGEPTMQDQELAKMTVLQFASRIFLAADNEDRAGQATKKTGRLFLVASQFFEVMRVFGELPEEIEERIKYAKWKAADIIKALNEGREPHPGPIGSGAEDKQQSPSSEVVAESAPTTSPSPPTDHNAQRASAQDTGILPSLSGQFSPPGPNLPTSLGLGENMPAPAPIVLPPINVPAPVVIGSPPSSIPASSLTKPPVSPVIDPITLSVAEKYARYAVSAIQFEDVPTAITNLQLCLDTLRGLGRGQNKGA